MKNFELYYHCSNGGDGSVSVRLHPTMDAAEKADEEMDEGWGESSAGSVKLKLEGSKLYYQSYEEGSNGKYRYVWIPIEEVKVDK